MKILSLNLGPGITAFSTERGQGCDASAPYSGFSICSYTGDALDHIRECRRALSARLGVADDRILTPRQTHSLNVATVTGRTRPEELEGVDGLVTATPRLALCINTADCVPVLMADPEAGVIAAVHSGWRGTVGEIVTSAVKKMVDLGASPDRIRAAFGPSICADCFEVGEEVAERFRHIPGAVIDTAEKPHVDLRTAITHSLLLSGIKPDMIDGSAPCSRCLHDRFFSARRLSVASGRTLSVIMLR